jgi:hypothetical protein
MGQRFRWRVAPRVSKLERDHMEGIGNLCLCNAREGDWLHDRVHFASKRGVDGSATCTMIGQVTQELDLTVCDTTGWLVTTQS